MSRIKTGIIISSTRQGRFGDKPAAWVARIAAHHPELDAEVVDLRDYPMPFFNEAKSPAAAPPANEVAQQWGAKLDSLDAMIFVVAEYNHGMPAVLKNALDYAYPQFKRKPAGFAGYGGVGAARAIEQLRLTCATLGMAPLSGGPNIAGADFMAASQGTPLSRFAHLEKAAEEMLANLIWWATALKTAREATS